MYNSRFAGAKIRRKDEKLEIKDENLHKNLRNWK